MTATETHRNAVRARWRPDLRGLRGGSASPGIKGSGRLELYGSAPYRLPAGWLPAYRVSPAYRGGVLRCPLPRPEGCGSCACGRSGRLITPKLTQSESGCCCDVAQTPHIWGRLAHHCAPINSFHCHSPPVGRPMPDRFHTNDIDPSTPSVCDQPVLRGHLASPSASDRWGRPGNDHYLHSCMCASASK
jgi:hypothetical protein